MSSSQIFGNLKVKAFLDSMSGAAVAGAVMTRQEMLERLSNLARVHMSDLVTWHISKMEDAEGNPVEQSLWSVKESALMDDNKMASISELTAGREGFKVKQHSPLAAMKQIAEIEGYNAPTQIETTSKEELTPWDSLTAKDET